MTSAFKYAARHHNESLLALGNLRIGTLHDFRRQEHKKGIADVNEGIKTVAHHIVLATENDKHHLDALRMFGAIDVRGATNVKITNAHMSKRFDHPDCFVHCISSDYSKSVLDQFEGADSCIEINDLDAFYDRLTKTLNLHVRVNLLAISVVHYMERFEGWNGRDWGIHPALIKEPNFKPQKEIRAIWKPVHGGKISPIVINDIELIGFCRKIKVPCV